MKYETFKKIQEEEGFTCKNCNNHCMGQGGIFCGPLPPVASKVKEIDYCTKWRKR